MDSLGKQVIRIWEFRASQDDFYPRRVVLRHKPLTQKIQVTVDNEELPEGHVKFVWQGIEGMVHVTAPTTSSLLSRFSNSYKYQCFLGDNLLPMNTELLDNAGEDTSDVKVEIPEIVIAGDGVVWYRLNVSFKRTYNNDVRVHKFTVHRRYRDFFFVYTQVCDSFRGTHLLSSIPSPPERKAKILANHYDSTFLHHRKGMLQGWLEQMLSLPTVASNPDMETFLGGMSEMREVSVVIRSGPIGLRLARKVNNALSENSDAPPTAVYPQAQVQDFVKNEDGSPGVAEASGLIGIGHVVSKVGGESVVHADYDVIIAKLKSAPRPLVIHFIGYVLQK